MRTESDTNPIPRDPKSGALTIRPGVRTGKLVVTKMFPFANEKWRKNGGVSFMSNLLLISDNIA